MNSIARAEHRVHPGQQSTARHILLIGIDGARWEMIPAQSRLAALAAEGSWHGMTMEVPTISGPGWSSILTGTTHAEHGVRDNSLIGARLWQHPDVLSRAFYRDQSTRTFAAAGWPVLVDPQGLGPVIHPRMEQQYAGLHNVIARDGETHGYERIDAEIAAITTAKLRAGGFDVGFVYFCDADDAGHVYGLVDGAGYRDALARIDAHVSDLVDAVTARAQAGEDWLVVLTTDHGHLDEGGHGGDDPRERESWVVAWSPTGALPEWPAEIAPHELCGMLLDARYTNR
ncbi:alkaline phosphatase family protein [Corynebacterium sp.]|uniref:alkaline phosphatase family protein n=1 Tax=Corynebacterium sp. TaxID=1720 RepID=UPI0026E013E0|nr:alkaline phosphatase family protein [Corynebacterium sp.]MDO5512537.1 alkaline phosphatase family protein [Corynebacterium sp.]